MNTVEVVIYVEKDCPFCNYVQKYILEDLIARHDELSGKLIRQGLSPLPWLDLKVIDIDANLGRRESRYFEWYSKRIGGRYTPVINIGDNCFYLWGKDKPRKLKEKHLSKTDFLKKQIIEYLQNKTNIPEKKETFYINNHKYFEGGINERIHSFESSRL